MQKIAVFPFEITGSHWGTEFSDAITHHFFKSGRVEVVEREAIEKVLREQNMTMTGAVDPNKAAEIGRLLGADVIIIGRGTVLRNDRFNNDVSSKNLIDTFSLKAISVETGSLLLTVRKEPGIAWDGEFRAKWCLSGTLIWDRNDVLVESSEYDEVAFQIVKRVLEAMNEMGALNGQK
jgi:hypothetical protein